MGRPTLCEVEVRALTGDDDGFRFGAGVADEVEEVEAVIGRIHAEIGDDEVEIFRCEVALGVGEVVGGFDGVAATGHASDGFSHDVGVIDFVINDENADGGGFGHDGEV